MRVYVETNFVLELALQQEQHAECDALLQLAEAQAIELVLPAYSVVEAIITLERRANERNVLLQHVERELREVARMQGYPAGAKNARDTMKALLVDAVHEARGRFSRVASRLQDSGVLLPLTGAELAKAPSLRTEYGLSYPDALVLASVLEHLERDPVTSCFLNRNTKDFDDPRIHERLMKQSCRLIGNFQGGQRYIQARRSQPS